jgi:hypothetical protein
MTETERLLREIFKSPRTDEEIVALMAHGFEDHIKPIVDKATETIEALVDTDANVFEVMLLHGIIMAHANRLFHAQLAKDLDPEAIRIREAIETIAEQAAEAINIAMTVDDATLAMLLREP